MKKLAAILLFATSAFGAEGDVVRGLQNLAQVQIIANALEQQKAVGKPLRITAELFDPWKTAYRLTINGTSYRIASAGADRKFDETQWSRPGQFRNFDDDIVFADGRFVRSNRNWLTLQTTDKEGPILKSVRDVEMFFMIARHPSMSVISAANVTMEAIKMVAQNIDTYRAAAIAPPIDGWGTPMRLIFTGEKGFRIVSAGADREFKPDTWTQGGSSRKAEDDIVSENGELVRRFDTKGYLESAPPINAAPVPQPTDAPLDPKAGKYAAIGGAVKAPTVVARVEPVYPESYRKARINGLVLLQLALSETGKIDDVRVLRSLAPEADVAAIVAALQWKFSPATRDGKPVPVLFNLTFNFKLQ